MSITFASVFLGLTLGVQPVALVVGGDVARVELLMDGELVAVDTHSPWEISCDFGDEPAPHELVAVAHDAAGAELERARQWVNLPRPEADGAKAAPERTAVAVEVGGRLHGLDVQALADRLMVEGVPAKAVEVEKGLAEVVVVMDREAQDDLRRMADLPPLKPATGRSITEAPIDRSIPGHPRAGDVLGRGGESAAGARAGLRTRTRTAMRLEEDQLLRIVWPDPGTEDEELGAVRPGLFPYTRGVPPSYGGMLWLLSTVRQPPFSEHDQRLADAVAAAGMMASASGRRRAIVLILGEEPSDASRLSPRAVRHYLQLLGVPLHVWALGPTPDEVAAAWGGIRQVPKKRELRRAVKELSEGLGRQRIVWLDGLHLPQSVALAQGAGDLRLAD